MLRPSDAEPTVSRETLQWDHWGYEAIAELWLCLVLAETRNRNGSQLTWSNGLRTCVPGRAFINCVSSLEKGIRLLTLLGETKPQLRALGPIPKQLSGRHTGWGHPTSAVASPSFFFETFYPKSFYINYKYMHSNIKGNPVSTDYLGHGRCWKSLALLGEVFYAHTVLWC